MDRKDFIKNTALFRAAIAERSSVESRYNNEASYFGVDNKNLSKNRDV